LYSSEIDYRTVGREGVLFWYMEDTVTTSNSYAKRPVWQWVVFCVVIAVVVYGGIYYFLTRNKSGGYQTNSAVVVSKQLFRDSPVYASAYQIFPGTLSADAKKAMNGFMTQTQSMADGTVVVTMTATNPEYKNQTYTVKPGETLYFIEKSLGDDAVGENKDNYLADDTAVVVDAQGVLLTNN
jgi:hypothetical protein